MARRRMFLTGSERAEFEHIHGPLPVDQTDPRFVLVSAEEEALILSLPAGVPVRPSQNSDEKAKIAAHFVKAAENSGASVGDGAEDFNANAFNVKPDDSVFGTPQINEGDNRDEPKGSAAPASPAEPVGKTAAPKSGRADAQVK